MHPPLDEKDPALLLEYAIASKLGELDAIRVELFASTFANQGKPLQNAQVRVGWSGSSYRTISANTISTIIEETARFEIEVELVDVRTHSKAMDYIRRAVILLNGFSPYFGIKPLIPIQAGDPRFNTNTNTWLYTALMSAAWPLKGNQYPDCKPIGELPEPIEIVLKVGRYAPPDYEIGPLTEL